MSKEMYQQIGKEMILNITEKYGELIKKANEKVLTDYYETADIYAFALQCIGQYELSEVFMEDAPSTKYRISKSRVKNDFLVSVLASLSTGNKEFVKNLLDERKDILYLDGCGYINPHWREFLPGGYSCDYTEIKDIMLRRIENQGLEKAQKGTYGENDSVKLSINESIYSINAHLALGEKEHAQKVITDIFYLYYNDKSKEINLDYDRHFTEIDTLFRFSKALDLAGDTRGLHLFEQAKSRLSQLEEHKERYSYLNYVFPTVANVLDHFEPENDVNFAKEKIIEGSKDYMRIIENSNPLDESKFWINLTRGGPIRRAIALLEESKNPYMKYYIG